MASTAITAVVLVPELAAVTTGAVTVTLTERRELVAHVMMMVTAMPELMTMIWAVSRSAGKRMVL